MTEQPSQRVPSVFEQHKWQFLKVLPTDHSDRLQLNIDNAKVETRGFH